MAEDLNAIFADAIVKAENASNIAYQWANGDDTTEVTTASGPLPSLAKFMVENVSEVSYSKLSIDLSSSDYSVTSSQLVNNIFIEASGNSVSRSITLPNISKLFFVSNKGSLPLNVVLGSSSFIVAPDAVKSFYSDGTTNGLIEASENQSFNNDTATVPPTITDDISLGYEVNSRWIDNSSNEVFRCIDPTAGAAVWVKTSLTLDELGSMASQNATNVNISGGIISGIQDLSIADGGTGASTAQQARDNLGATLVTDSVATLGQDWAGIALTGADLTALGIVGTSPQASLYPDGTIVGSSSNGEFTLYPNGDLECRHTSGTVSSTTAVGSLFRTTLQTLTFPLPFATNPDIGVATESVATGVGWVAGNVFSASDFSWYIISYVSGAQNKVSYIAKGRAV